MGVQAGAHATIPRDFSARSACLQVYHCGRVDGARSVVVFGSDWSQLMKLCASYKPGRLGATATYKHTGVLRLKQQVVQMLRLSCCQPELRVTLPSLL